jgi:hypothetical protein
MGVACCKDKLVLGLKFEVGGLRVEVESPPLSFSLEKDK